jgi:hypothetical protein
MSNNRPTNQKLTIPVKVMHILNWKTMPYKRNRGVLRLDNLVFLTVGIDCFRARAVAPGGSILPSGNRSVVMRTLI